MSWGTLLKNKFDNLQLIKSILIILCLLILNSCETANNKVGEAFNLDTDLKLQIIAERNINLDEQNQASPVVIRLYELTSNQVFEKTNFIDLYERDEEVLGDTFIAKQNLSPVIPSSERTERFVLSKNTRFVALFAEFYRYKGSRAKVVFPITSSNVIRNSVRVKISDNTITLEK